MCVRYNSNTNKRSEDENMERVKEPKNSIFATLKDSYNVVRSRPNFNIYPQMPIKQIQYYIKQAARKEEIVAIQLNPSGHSKHITEIAGKISLSPTSSQIILTPMDKLAIHLIQPQYIRHLRLS